MKAFKIFVDCHVFDGNSQGTTTYLKGLYLELIKNKNQTYFLVAFDTENIKKIFGNHENVIYLKYKSKNKFYRLLFDIPKLITKNKIDFAHFQYIVPPIKRCKYIVTIHDVLFLDFPEFFPILYQIKNKLLFKFSAKKSDIVLTVSNYSKERIQAHFGLNKIQITPNAVDSVYFEKYDKSDEIKKVKQKFNIEHYFLFVSRWEPRKNHHTLLKTFVEHHYYRNYKLVLVGNDAIYNKEYSDYFNTLGDDVKSQIIKLQNIDFDDLIHLVRASSISVYPSFAEGFGIPPLESVASQIPTVCSNATAMSDFDFFEDCLFDPSSCSDLNLKIQNALNDTKVLQKQSQVKSRFNWTLSANSFSDSLDI